MASQHLLISKNVKSNYYKYSKTTRISQTLICFESYTRTRWTTSATYGRWTYECTKHKCNTEGRSQWTTSKCTKISCAKRPNGVLNHSLKNTTNDNPTMGSECLSWWQSWTYSIIWWSCLYAITMAICNPRLQFTHNRCIYTNYNTC